MTISNLYARYILPPSADARPLVIFVHGWDGDADAFNHDVMNRWHNHGFFVCSVGMRGRNNAGGARDASGREVHDIYDALLHIRSAFPAYVSTDKAALVGFSGGGGNVLGAACKCPDAWNVLVDFYGMSDYGRDGTDGWYFQNPTFAAAVGTAVGGTPAAVPDNYYARDATAAIANYSGGRLVLFHDLSDNTVPPVQSQRVVTAMSGAGLSNYEAHYSQSGDPERWTHGFDLESATAIAAEAIWTPLVADTPAWTVPATGTVTVIGYIVTKRFKVWLGTGLSEVASVAYGAVANEYLVTPLTGSVAVTITQSDGKTVAQTIDTPTTLVVA